MNDKINFETICRTCLREYENPNYIFDIEQETQLSIAEMLSEFTRLHIQLTDKLPQNICNICKEFIKNVIIFRNQWEQNERLLLNYLNGGKVQDYFKENEFMTYPEAMPVASFGIMIKEENALDCTEVESDSYDKYLSENEGETNIVNTNTSSSTTKNQKTSQKCKTSKNKSKQNDIESKETIKNIKAESAGTHEVAYLDGAMSQEKLIFKIEETPVTETSASDIISSLSKPKKRIRKKPETKPIRFYNHACEICHKIYSRPYDLKVHMVKHYPENKRFECSVCNKKFTHKHNMQEHVRRMHDKNYVPKPIVKKPNNKLCALCGKTVTSLVIHMRRHAGVKPFKCDICDRAFTRLSDVRHHKKSHTGEKPHLCTSCGKGFVTTYKLKRHLRIHTGERPYKCTYCEQAFLQSKDLKNHVYRHTGQKPHECGDCGKRFIQKTALRTHCRSQGHNYEKCISHEPPSTTSILIK